LSPPRTTVWPIEEHTRGKHAVLREYLAAWFPILGSFARRLVFIDGFAGPGEYDGGEPGSPVIALEAYRQYGERFKGEVIFLFVENDAERMARLQEVVSKLPKLPGNVKLWADPKGFEPAITRLLDGLRPGAALAPAFVMVDPFGVKDYPMSLLTRILKSGRVELYISFMYEFIDRFKSTPEFEKHLTELYGTDEWKAGLDVTGEAKKEFYFGLYKRQLKAAGAKHVLRFDLYRAGRLVYALFFATQHWRGSDVMKRAMWKVAPFGDFAFRGRGGSQLLLPGAEPDYSTLRAAIRGKFKGIGWVTIEMVKEFVASDETDFHTGQYKKAVLVPLECEGLLEVDPASRKKARTFPDGTKLRFV
jgi:three-Cys-motif partner protein